MRKARYSPRVSPRTGLLIQAIAELYNSAFFRDEESGEIKLYEGIDETFMQKAEAILFFRTNEVSDD